LDGGCDEDRARLGGALDSRGNIGRIAEHFTRCVDHHLPGIKADARGKFRGAFADVSGVDFDKGHAFFAYPRKAVLAARYCALILERPTASPATASNSL